MPRLPQALLACLALATVAGCTEHWEQREVHGVFEKTTYWERDRLDWEGGNSRLIGSRVCSSTLAACLDDPYSQFDTSGRAIVLGGADADRALYNRSTGTVIPCLNCNARRPLTQILDYRLSWSATGDLALAAERSALIGPLRIDEAINAKQYRVWLLQVEADGVRVAAISPGGADYRFGEPLKLEFSPREQALGWFLCDPRCALWHYDIAAATYGRTATGCGVEAYDGSWQIAWSDGLPRLLLGSSRARDACPDASDAAQAMN